MCAPICTLKDQRREQADYEPPVPALFGEKEGKIAKANRGRDPLYLFSALQRQLGYPTVPRPKPRDDMEAKLEALKAKVRDLETRLKVIDAELKGQVDFDAVPGETGVAQIEKPYETPDKNDRAAGVW